MAKVNNLGRAKPHSRMFQTRLPRELDPEQALRKACRKARREAFREKGK